MNGWLIQNADYLVFMALVAAGWAGLHVWLRRRRLGHDGLHWRSFFLVAGVVLGGWLVVDYAGRVAGVLDLADAWKARLLWISFLGVLVIILLSGATVIAILRHDLAERVQIEEKLREQSELRRLLFDHAPGGVTLSDLEFHLLEVNEAYCQMLGYSREELLQLTFVDVTHPADREKAVAINRQIVHGQQPAVLLERRYLHKNGSVIEAVVRVGLIHDEGGVPQYIVGQITDVTGRRRVESELLMRQKQLAAILEHAPIMLFAVDPQGIFTLSEGAGLAAIGREPGDAVGRSIYDRYATRPDILADVRRTLAGETVAAQREFNGNFFETHYAPVRDDSGKISGLIGIAYDVTSRERIERERKKMERQLQDMQKLESLGVLAGGVAHDFNNLLTSILGHAGLARLALGAGSPALTNLEKIEQASQTAANLCRQLLAYSGRGRLETSEVDLGELIRDLTERLQLAAGSRARLQSELAAELPTIIADQAHLRQVLLHLVLNAAETLQPGGGVIRIVTRMQTVDAAWLAEASVGREIRPGEYVCLELSDNGPGLSPETQARLFDPFFLTKAPERGLGLAATLGIMRSHQGALKLWSQPGLGTCFSLIFPPHARRSAAPAAVGENWRGHGQVLIVDDEETVRSTAAQMIAFYGFDVRQASSGQQAIDILGQSPVIFDLVLLDLTMPGMDGYATFSALRKVRPTQRIVVFSGYSERDAQQRFAGKNLTGFLQKPFSADALRDILRLACSD